MTDGKGAGMNEQMYSDVMTDTQASRFGGYSDGYNAGRKAERERCAKIAENEAGEIPECMTGRIIAEKIRKGDEDERG